MWSWAHWLFDLKTNNSCHSISFKLAPFGLFLSRNANGCVFFKSPILKSEPNHTVCLLTFFLCGKNFPSLINIFKCTFLFILCLESRCYYQHLVFHSRCVSETFILKPFLDLESFWNTQGVCQLKDSWQQFEKCEESPLLWCPLTLKN